MMFRATAVRVKDKAGIRDGVVCIMSVDAGAVPKLGQMMLEEKAQEYHLRVTIDEGKAIDTETMEIVSISPSDRRYRLIG